MENISLKDYNSNNRMFEDKRLEKQKSGAINPRMFYSALWDDNIHYGIEFLYFENDIRKAKNQFNICGLIDEYQINNFNSRLLDYGFQHACYAVLSDNEALIQRYAKLRYQRGVNAELSMHEMVARGESTLTCNTIQFFMENNTQGIEENLAIYERFKSKALRNGKELEYDYEFFKALYAEDKAKMEEILEVLTSQKVHKKRNDNPILSQYISLPALGYAKLAWRKGIEVEVKSKLVPKELLPIIPNDVYEIPYDFLK